MNESTDLYRDIIDLPHHRSTRHHPMPRADRAAQFSSFAALTGHSDAIRETARLTDTAPDLSDSAKAEIDSALHLITQKPGGEILLTYFIPDPHKSGGASHTITTRARQVSPTHLHLEDGRAIPLSAILAIVLG
ncbi:MAG: hypothetical protein J1E42_08575 [Akkermansiaceae bacterium]|nr:hypothetical protein [Akkermansiaceae bacterium]